MKKPYYRLIKLGIFPYDILVCHGMTMDQVRQHIEDKYKVRTFDHEAWDDSDQRAGKTLHLATNQTIIWLRQAPRTPSAIGTLVHEALHGILQIYKTMGVPFSAENDEVVAYAVEHIVEEVLKDFHT